MHDNGYSLSEPFLITQAMQAVKAILTLTLKKGTAFKCKI